MMTPDKDYGQLVNERVKMYRPKFGDKDFEIMGVKEVTEKFDISSPTQVIDILGLMGDASDNIPGCPGVGGKPHPNSSTNSAVSKICWNIRTN